MRTRYLVAWFNKPQCGLCRMVCCQNDVSFAAGNFVVLQTTAKLMLYLQQCEYTYSYKFTPLHPIVACIAMSAPLRAKDISLH